MPPTRSERVGFSMRFSSVLPCAVAMSCTPRSAIVRADAGPAEKQNAAARLDDVADDLHRPVHRAADAQREADDLARAVTKRADAVERALDAGAIVATELPDVADHVREVLGGDLPPCERLLASSESRLGQPPEVHHDLKKTFKPFQRAHPLCDIRGKAAKERFELVALFNCHRFTGRGFVASEDTRGDRVITKSAGQPTSLPARGNRSAMRSSTWCSERATMLRPASSAPIT